MQNDVYVIPDVHCRSFYKPILNVMDKPVVFLGDYMDPYGFENTSDEEGISNLREILDYKKKRGDNVTLLLGNHDCSWMWSRLGWERTSLLFYPELHQIYREHVEYFEPFHVMKDTLFMHAGICEEWMEFVGVKNEDVLSFISTEFAKELDHEKAIHGWDNSLNSLIFNVGSIRGGYGYGGPFWHDVREGTIPEDFPYFQVYSHTQLERTGNFLKDVNNICCDSRAIFEYDLQTHELQFSEINTDETKKEYFAWKNKHRRS